VQLLGYLSKIWDLHWKQYPDQDLPIIVPILLYHGNRNWDKGNKFSNILEEPAKGFEKFIPDYNYLLYDFSGLTDSEIKGNIKLRIYSYLTSQIFIEDFHKVLSIVIPLLIELEKQKTAMDYIVTVLTYIMSVYQEVSTFEELKQEVAKVSNEGREMVMTIAEQLLEEGKEEGRIENMQEMIGFALELKFGYRSKKLSNEIRKINSYEKLKDMKGVIKTADSLDEFKEKTNL